MRRLAPFLLAAIMATLPPSLLLLFIGGLASTPLTSSCAHRDTCVGVGVGVGVGVDVVSGLGSPGGGWGVGSGFATASAAYASSPSSHHRAASIASAATVAYASGGKQLLQPASAQPAGGGTPRQLHPMQQQQGQGQVQQGQGRGGWSVRKIEDDSDDGGGGDAAGPASSGGGGTAAEAPPDTLKVSVLGASRGKSSDCSYSLVEFSNTHHQDTIIVHSAYIEPTTVFPPMWVKNNVDLTTGISYYSSPRIPPPSFHGDYYQERQLHIPPRTAVTIPVSIIPHCRKPPDELGVGSRRRHHYRKLDDGGGATSKSSENKEGADGGAVEGWVRKWRGRALSSSSASTPSSPTDQDGGGGRGDDDELPFLAARGRGNETVHNHAIHADLLDMIQNSLGQHGQQSLPTFVSPAEFRASFLESAGVHETLVANTSWGFVQMKVPYVCSPSHSLEYEFGLPNNLVFLDGGGGWYARRNTTPTVELAYLFGDWEFNPTRDHMDPFAYRLYMNNPTGRPLKVWEVFTTKPHLVGAKMQFNFDTSAANPRMNDASYYYPLQSSPSAADIKTNIWVVTVRLFPEMFSPNMTSSMQDLGFLELRTNLGDFSVALDFLPNGRRGGVIHGIGENHSSLEDVHLVRDHVANSLLSSVASGRKPPMEIVKTYRSPDLQEGDWEARAPHLNLMREHALNDAAMRRVPMADPRDSFIKATPDKIDFGSITTGSRVVRIPLKIGNQDKGGRPLRVMRISVAMSTVSDDSMGNVTDISEESHRMEIGIDFTEGTPSPWVPLKGEPGDAQYFVLPHEIVLPVAPDYEYAFHVWCRFNAAASSSSTVTPRFYTGSILIHATQDGFVRYGEWERTQLLDHQTWGRSPLTLEVPFEGSVLPGNLGSPTASLLFPTHFYVLPIEERVRAMQRTNGRVPEHYDRELDVTNNFAVPISIVGMRVLDSPGEDEYCSNRFSVPTFDGRAASEGFPTSEAGQKWKGLSVRYHYRGESGGEGDGNTAVRKCILSLETDRAGKQSLPLIVYSGEVSVDIVRPEGGHLTVHCLVTKTDGTAAVSRSGMPCMQDWMSSTIEGMTLNNAIASMESPPRTKKSSGKRSSKARPCPAADPKLDAVTSYFQSLLSGSLKGSAGSGSEIPHHTLQPVVLSFGSVRTGKSAERSLLLTNMNHAPIEIAATVASLGNMDVRMATVPSALTDAFRGLMDRHSGEAAHFLHHSPEAQEFFGRFGQKFDVLPSTRASGTELMSLFHRHAVVDVFENATEYIAQNFIPNQWNEMECSCGFMIAIDGTYKKDLTRKKAGKKRWVLPPGGVARFVVTVTAPSKSELTNDVTSFVGAGLVLETNHGQALPIVLTYSAIAGQMHLKPSGGEDYNVTLDVAARRDVQGAAPDTTIEVRVPLTLKDPNITMPVVEEHAHRVGVSLSIESTFAQDVFLNEIRSCNKWFNVFLPADNAPARAFFNNNGSRNLMRVRGTGEEAPRDDSKKLLLGKVLSALSCSHPSGDTSFYACALAWLENRDQIQPTGCGLAEADLATNSDHLNFAASSDTAEQRGLAARMSAAKTHAIGALRDVVAFLSVRYVEEPSAGVKSGGAESGGGYVHFSRIHMFEHARKTWADVVSMGLNAITGHVDAKTVYFANPDSVRHFEANGERQGWQTANAWSNPDADSGFPPPLFIPASSVLLKSSLEIPRLFAGDREEGGGSDVGAVDFGAVHVADVSAQYVAVSNPTSMAVRVRLAAVDSIDGTFGEDKLSRKDVFVQATPDDRHPWWTGGSYWMADDAGRLISASHNVTIKSGAGAYVSLLNPALHAMSAFVLGCGRRCGLRNDADSNGEEKLHSPVGAASGDGGALLGRSREGSKSATADDGKSPEKALGITDPPSFSLGRVAGEVVVPPHGTAELGPVYFRPPGRGTYEGTVYIENSLTGFEEVRVRGRGGWEHLVFLDQRGPDGDVDPGGGDVEFRFGQSTLVFPGGVAEGRDPPGGPAVRSARLANRGDVPVEISGVRMASSEIMHFTHKRRHPSSIRSDDGSNDRGRTRCEARGFVLPGCIDPSSELWIEWLFSWCWDVVDRWFDKIFPPPSKPSEEATDRAEQMKMYAKEAENFYKNGFTLQPNQTQSIYVFHYPDCSFQTSYASVIFEIGDRSDEGHSSRSRVGSWQQTFRQRKVELLVGYDMTAAEFRNCVPYSPPETPQTSIWERKMEFQLPALLQDVLSFGLTRVKDKNGNPYVPRRPIQATLLAASFLLLLFALSLDLLFTVEIVANRKTCPSWKPTCRCLARADPTSSDLVSIGKEQTKHVLLSRYKKEGVLPSHCVGSDGSFVREEGGLFNAGSGTHSEAIFDRLNLVNGSRMEKEDSGNFESRTSGLLSCGLSWRTALRRGVGLPSSSPKNGDASGSAEAQYLGRTRERYLKRREEQKAAAKKIASGNATALQIAPPAASAAPATAVPSKATSASAAKIINGNSAAAKSIKMPPVVVSLPQDRKVECPRIKKKIPTTPSNGRSNLYASKPAPQAKLSTISNTSSLSKKGSSNVKPPVVARNSSLEKLKNVDTAKAKQQQQKASAGWASNVVQTEQKSKVVEIKSKQKQAKQAKNERASRTEMKTDTTKQEDSSTKKAKSITVQKARSKPVTGNTSPGWNAKDKQEEKRLQENTITAASPSRKDSPVNHTKQARQTKKSTNGTKNTDQPKGKQGKQKSALKKAAAKNPPKPPVPTIEKTTTTTQRSQPDAEYPPLSSSPAPSPMPYIRSNTAPSRVPTVRPPPGLLAPPGFLDQPDLEGLSTPSSPASSPQRLSLSHNRSPNHSPPSSQPTVPDTIPGMEIIHSPPQNNDLLLSLIGNSADHCKKAILESSPLFQATHPNDYSPPRVGSDGALSLPPVFRPQSFTPPVLEPSFTAVATMAEGGANEAPDVQALLGSGSDFNVSNFLDGILSESMHPPQPIVHETVQQKQQVKVTSESIPFQAKATIGSVSLDPWNSVSNSLMSPDTSINHDPLAVLQGTVIQNHQESSVIAGIPLNNNAPSLLANSTSSMLQNKSSNTAIAYAKPAYASFISDEAGGDDDFLEPDSFYNQLLGED